MIFRFGTKIALIGGEHDLLTNRHEGSGESPQVVKTRPTTMATQATTVTPFSNMAMSEAEITAIMQDSIRKGAWMKVRMITIARMNKKGNPFYGDCFKDSTSLYVSGVSYERMINLRLKRKGLPPVFEAEASSGMHHDDDDNIIMVANDGQKHYIDLKQYKDCWRETRYIHADGREYTEYEKATLSQFLVKSSFSAKQEIAGLTEEEGVLCIRPDVRNIMSIKQTQEILFTHTEEVEVLR